MSPPRERGITCSTWKSTPAAAWSRRQYSHAPPARASTSGLVVIAIGLALWGAQPNAGRAVLPVRPGTMINCSSHTEIDTPTISPPGERKADGRGCWRITERMRQMPMSIIRSNSLTSPAMRPRSAPRSTGGARSTGRVACQSSELEANASSTVRRSGVGFVHGGSGRAPGSWSRTRAALISPPPGSEPGPALPIMSNLVTRP